MGIVVIHLRTIFGSGLTNFWSLPLIGKRTAHTIKLDLHTLLQITMNHNLRHDFSGRLKIPSMVNTRHDGSTLGEPTGIMQLSGAATQRRVLNSGIITHRRNDNYFSNIRAVSRTVTYESAGHVTGYWKSKLSVTFPKHESCR